MPMWHDVCTSNLQRGEEPTKQEAFAVHLFGAIVSRPTIVQNLGAFLGQGKVSILDFVYIFCVYTKFKDPQ